MLIPRKLLRLIWVIPSQKKSRPLSKRSQVSPAVKVSVLDMMKRGKVTYNLKQPGQGGSFLYSGRPPTAPTISGQVPTLDKPLMNHRDIPHSINGTQEHTEAENRNNNVNTQFRMCDGLTTNVINSTVIMNQRSSSLRNTSTDKNSNVFTPSLEPDSNVDGAIKKSSPISRLPRPQSQRRPATANTRTSAAAHVSHLPVPQVAQIVCRPVSDTTGTGKTTVSKLAKMEANQQIVRRRLSEGLSDNYVPTALRTSGLQKRVFTSIQPPTQSSHVPSLKVVSAVNISAGAKQKVTENQQELGLICDAATTTSSTGVATKFPCRVRTSGLRQPVVSAKDIIRNLQLQFSKKDVDIQTDAVEHVEPQDESSKLASETAADALPQAASKEYIIEKSEIEDTLERHSYKNVGITWGVDLSGEEDESLALSSSEGIMEETFPSGLEDNLTSSNSPVDICPPTPSPPSPVEEIEEKRRVSTSASLSVSDGQQDFFIEDEIADQPGLTLGAPQHCDGENSIEIPVLVNPVGLALAPQTSPVNNPVSGRRGRRRRSSEGEESVGTLSNCDSITSDLLSLDHDDISPVQSPAEGAGSDSARGPSGSAFIFTPSPPDSPEENINNTLANEKLVNGRTRLMTRTNRSVRLRNGEPLSGLPSVENSPRGPKILYSTRLQTHGCYEMNGHSLSSTPNSSPEIPLDCDSTERFNIQQESYDLGLNIQNDIQSMKRQLEQVQMVLNEAEELDPFDGHSTPSRTADEEISDLRRQIVYLRAQLNERNQTIRDLQHRLQLTCTVSNEGTKETFNSATQTDCELSERRERDEPSLTFSGNRRRYHPSS